MNYAEYLKENGATEEEIKILDTATARKAFDKLQNDGKADRDAAANDRAAAKKERDNMTNWFEQTAVPEFKDMERRAIASEANEAKLKVAWQSAYKQGVVSLEQLQALGINADGTPPPPKDNAGGLPPGFDPSKFVTADSLKGIADTAGDGLAALQDIVMEHAQLFPDRPLRVRELRREAVANNMLVENYWMQKYGVSAAREKRAADEKAAYEKRLREEGAAEVRREFAAHGNPDVRPFVNSANPWTERKKAAGDKQPWERSGDNVTDRVNRATTKLVDRMNQAQK
jgi:hypothetical protein